MPINNERFLFYADYYSLAASSGLERARLFFDSVNAISLLDKSSITNLETVNLAIEGIKTAIDLGYEMLWSDGQSITHMRAAFVSLADHVKKASGNRTLDGYLTEQGLQVSSTFAQISRITGNPISTSNIEN